LFFSAILNSKVRKALAAPVSHPLKELQPESLSLLASKDIASSLLENNLTRDFLLTKRCGEFVNAFKSRLSASIRSPSCAIIP